MKKGLFLTIEGVEGVGKSTNLAHIESHLAQRDVAFVTTREPGGTPLGENIRELLLARSEDGMDPVTELLMMFAARVEHVEKVIKPALADGLWVISDRFTDSSYAYQGGGRGLSSDLIAQIEAATLGDFRPDATLILDLPVATGLDRAARVGEKDRFESEAQSFFESVRAVFLDRAAASDRYRVIDAGLPLADVQAGISQWLDELR